MQDSLDQLIKEAKEISTTSILNQQYTLKGLWKISEGSDNTVVDLSGNDNPLIPTANIAKNDLLSRFRTNKAVVNTLNSFSVAAWVYLDSTLINSNLELEPNEYALTAVSQDSATHSAFYLGIRKIAEPGSSDNASLRWNFTVSPIDGSETGPVEWLHAYTTTPLNNSILDKWIFLVGVSDHKKRSVHLYLPESNESGVAFMPDVWTFWKAEGGLQVGRGRWLTRDVDFWPGQVGTIHAFESILNPEDVKKLYLEGIKNYASASV